MLAKGMKAEEVDKIAPHRVFTGNRPSVTILYQQARSTHARPPDRALRAPRLRRRRRCSTSTPSTSGASNSARNWRPACCRSWKESRNPPAMPRRPGWLRISTLCGAEWFGVHIRSAPSTAFGSLPRKRGDKSPPATYPPLFTGDRGGGGGGMLSHRNKDLTPIKGILFDKDGTLVDFQETWYAIGDCHGAARRRTATAARPNALMEAAGYDLAAQRFKADSVFAAGTNADIVALWYPAACPRRPRGDGDAFRHRSRRSRARRSQSPLPGSQEAHREPACALASALGVATNDSTGGAEKTLLALGVAQMFDAAYGYDAVANPKPAPDTSRRLLRPDRAEAVGDRHGRRQPPRSGNGAGQAASGWLSACCPAPARASRCCRWPMSC